MTIRNPSKAVSSAFPLTAQGVENDGRACPVAVGRTNLAGTGALRAVAPNPSKSSRAARRPQDGQKSQDGIVSSWKDFTQAFSFACHGAACTADGPSPTKEEDRWFEDF